MERKNLIRTASGVLLLISIPLAARSAAVASPGRVANLYGHNLIVNGDAEAGPGATNDSTFITPTGWTNPSTPGAKGLTAITYTSGQDLSSTTPGPVNRGKNYFYGGPSGGKDTSAEQRIDLSGASAAIDAGQVSLLLSGWLGGYSNQRDNATLRATFLDAHGNTVGTASIGPVTAAMRKGVTELVPQSLGKTVPVGARTAVLDLLMKWYDGSDNDGLADNLSLVLTLAAPTPSPTPASGPMGCTGAPSKGTPVATLTPANLAVEPAGSPISFTWKAVACAAGYDFQAWLQTAAGSRVLGRSTTILTAQWVSRPALSLTTARWVSGVYVWRVIATDQHGSTMGAWSAPRTFTLQ